MMIAVYAGIAAFALGALAGWQAQGWRWGAADAERLAVEQRDTLRRMDKADEASAGFEQRQAVGRERVRVITREVDRVVLQDPVYRDVCLSDDGLRIVAQALGAAPGASQPAPAVPAASAAR